MIEVFELIAIENSTEGFTLRGRAYEDIKKGDILLTKDKNKIKIERIFSYQRETDLLSGMMTGDLLVNRDFLDNLKSGQKLYKYLQEE